MGEGEGGEEGDVHRLFWIAGYFWHFRSDGGGLKSAPSFFLGSRHDRMFRGRGNLRVARTDCV